MSKKKFRKPRPSPPKWFWWDADGCWWCDNRNACNGCKYLKRYVYNQREKVNRKEKSSLRNLDINTFLLEELEEVN